MTRFSSNKLQKTAEKFYYWFKIISITPISTELLGTILKIENISVATGNEENMPVQTDILVS